MPLESFLTNELTPALTREVEGFLDSQETGHPFQFPQWHDPGSRIMLLRESGSIRWLGTFGIHFPLGPKVPWIRAASANRGPVCDDLSLWAAMAEEVAEMMARERIAYFEASPEWIQQPGDGRLSIFNNARWERVEGQRASLRLDLKSSEDEIFANFSKTTRYEVRHAERLKVTVSVATSDLEIDEFLHVYQGLAARKGFPAGSIEHMRRVIHWLVNSESRGALLLARAENLVRGGAVVGRAGRRCWYIWGASDKQQPVNVGHIVQWNALQWARSHGCAEYDFGGYTPGATSGPAWFKAGFGGTAVYFEAPHRRITRAGRYRAYRMLRKIRSSSLPR